MANKPVITEYHKSSNTQSYKAKWWSESPDNVHSSVIPIVNQIQQSQAYRAVLNQRYARLYGNLEILASQGASLWSRTSTISNSLVNANRITLNIVKACVDTAAAKIAKNKPRPLYLTSGGDWSLQRKAKLLTKYNDGVFECSDIYREMPKSFIDSCVFGTGFVKIFVDNGDIKAERIHPDEITVDDYEGIYGKPRQIHQTRYINRDVLVDLFPKKEHEIMQCEGRKTDGSGSPIYADQIQVVESWHLRSSKEAKDGRHTMTITNADLIDEEYKKDYFPFIVLRWNHRLSGFFGQGLAEELIGIQLEINKILRSIQQALNLVAVPRIFLENGSKINKQAINNAIGEMVSFSGTPPIFHTPQMFTPEVYDHLERLWNRGFEVTGISQLSATAKKPSGLDAAVALREYQDIESERFMLVGQRYEAAFLDASRIMIDMTKDLYQEDKKIAVKVKSKKFIETIPWKEVDLEEDEYSLQLFPTSLLPQTPQGRLAKVQEMLQGGLIDPVTAKSLLDFPDLESVMSLENAAKDNVAKLIELAMEKGKYLGVDKYMNLELVITTMQEAYLKYLTENAPEEKLDLLRRYMEDALGLLQQGTTPPMPTAESLLGDPSQPSGDLQMPIQNAPTNPMPANQLNIGAN